MDLIKLVDYSDSDNESTTTGKTPRATPTPITFRGKRIFRRIIQSGDAPSTVSKASRKPTTRKKKKVAYYGSTTAPEAERKGTPTKSQWTKEEMTRFKLNFETPITPDCKTSSPSPLLSTICSSSIVVKSFDESTPFKNSEKGTPKNKRWTRDEANRLKLALKASVNPTTDEHWEMICRSVGGNHSIEDCRERALKLQWKPPTPGTKIDRSKPAAAENNEEEDSDSNNNNFDIRGGSPWTRAALNMRKSRKSVECNNKFFSDKVTNLTFTELNLDDSLFAAAFSTPPQQAKAARRPFLIRVVADEDVEDSSSDDNY